MESEEKWKVERRGFGGRREGEVKEVVKGGNRGYGKWSERERKETVGV